MRGSTTRVENDLETLPALVHKYLDMTSPSHSYGDFDVCPVEPDRPGHMRQVRVAGADKRVVKNVHGLQPPFRPLPTWRMRARPERDRTPKLS